MVRTSTKQSANESNRNWLIDSGIKAENYDYFSYNNPRPGDYESPLECFIESMKEYLNKEDPSDEFLRSVWKEGQTFQEFEINGKQVGCFVFWRDERK